jgi:HK97 family phage major capsid protein
MSRTKSPWHSPPRRTIAASTGTAQQPSGACAALPKIALDGNHARAKVTAASGHATYGQIDATDLANLMAGVRASAMPRAAWFASSLGFALTFARLAGSSGGVLTSGQVDGVATPFFNGFPVILAQKLPQVATTLTGQGMLAFGDMYAGAVIGQRRGLTIARSDHRYLDTDQIAILGTERFDAVVHDMGDNTNAGSLAVLVAP